MQDSANRLPFSPPSSLAAPQLRVGGGEKLCGTAPNFKPGSSCSCYQQAVQTDKVHINARWERGLVFLPTPTNREHRYTASPWHRTALDAESQSFQSNSWRAGGKRGAEAVYLCWLVVFLGHCDLFGMFLGTQRLRKDPTCSLL